MIALRLAGHIESLITVRLISTLLLLFSERTGSGLGKKKEVVGCFGVSAGKLMNVFKARRYAETDIVLFKVWDTLYVLITVLRCRIDRPSARSSAQLGLGDGAESGGGWLFFFIIIILVFFRFCVIRMARKLINRPINQ